MKARHKRFVLVALGIVAVGVAAALINMTLQSNLSYYFSPSQVRAGEAPQEHVFRVGGLVEEGSVKRQADGLTVHFVVTDTRESVKGSYSLRSQGTYWLSLTPLITGIVLCVEQE